MPGIVMNNEFDIVDTARSIIQNFGDQRVIAFFGKMGIGKTRLIKAICAEMKVLNTVTSPTFSIVNEYKTENGKIIYHFDFYRINRIEEIYDFGYEEYFYSGHYCFIEWPDQALSILPHDTFKIFISENQEGKRVVEF
jgi:tRNA threonylcarbamoyladenosine biosynthesis protein TsaE